jgi:hypothetical protein
MSPDTNMPFLKRKIVNPRLKLRKFQNKRLAANGSTICLIQKNRDNFLLGMEEKREEQKSTAA